MKIAILGNSKRTDFLEEKLSKDGNEVQLFKDSSLPNYFNHDLIILPIPTTNKEGYLNFKDGSKIEPTDFLNRVNPKTKLITCNFNNENYDIVDINKREDFAYLNAIPTAEAAMLLAVQNLGITIYKAKCLICGFGRIGKMLASKLKSLNAYVSVSARNPKDLAYISALDLKPVNYTEFCDKLSDYDVVFQTVPYQILTEEVLKKQSARPLIIELSSSCIGTDMKAAEKLKFKAVDATNLPEKFMPNTAGTILYDVIMRILEERKEKI